MTERSWRVAATVEGVKDGWACSPQVPTFYVDAVSPKEAALKAANVLNPHGDRIPHFSVWCEATGEYLDADKEGINI